MRLSWQRIPFPLHLAWDTPLVRLGWLALAGAAGLGLAILPLPAAGLLLAGTTIMLAVLIEPLIGLALTLLAGPFGALENVILGGTSIDSGQLLLVLTLAAWLARGVARREIRLPRVERALAIPLGLFVGVGVISLCGAPSLTLGVKEVLKWMQVGLVAWFAADTPQPRDSTQTAAAVRTRLKLVTAAVLLAGSCQALIGIWQFGLRGHGPEHFEILGRFFRAYGTFEQPNPFAGYLGLTLPIAVGIGIGGLGSTWGKKAGIRSQTPRSLIAALIIAAILSAALLMSWSRGGWLGAAGGLTAMAFFWPRKRWMGALLVLMLAAAILGALQSGLLPDQFAARLVGFASDIQVQDARGMDITPTNYAVLERTAHWQAALSMADEFPWLGVGFGNYEAAYSDYALLNWPYALGHAHNYYLNLLAEAGVAGLAAYLLLWATIIWQTARVIRFASYPLRGLALGLMGAWVHLSVHHLVDKLYVNNIYLHLGALIGILILLQRDAHLVGAAGSATSLDAEETPLLPGSWLPAEEYADPN